MAHRNLAQGLETLVVAFDGDRLLARGAAGEVALIMKRRIESSPEAQVLVFDGETARPVEIDTEGSDEEVTRFVESWGRLKPPTKPAAREVTLLPRHWEWLDAQGSGASAALRRLVENAMRSPEDVARRAREAAYRFVLTMAGDRAGFEDATRALDRGDVAGFEAASADWPPDVRDWARELAARAFGPTP